MMEFVWVSSCIYFLRFLPHICFALVIKKKNLPFFSSQKGCLCLVKLDSTEGTCYMTQDFLVF